MNHSPKASLPGEVIPQHEFYSYEAKYLDDKGALLKIPAPLTDSEVKMVKDLACKTFKVMGCDGLSRVDFFLTKAGKLYVNEINTLPGFTKISMYPKMWEASGLGYTELITELIEVGFEKYRMDNELKTDFR
jgi:D-alanine-D-alanine ligase